jgi:integrase/recombinase XerD
MKADRNGRVAVIVQHEGKRVKRTFDSRQEAKAWKAEAKEALACGMPLEAATLQPTMEDLLKDCARDVWDSAKDWEGLYSRGRKVVDLVGPKTLVESIGAVHVDRVRAGIKAMGSSPATINRYLSALSRLLTYAHGRGWLSRIPKIEKDREPEPRSYVFSKAQEQALIQQLSPDVCCNIVRFLLYTGLRLGELYALQPDDFGYDCVVVRGTKTSKPRTVPIPRQHLATDCSVIATLITSGKGLPSISYLRRKFNAALAAIGLGKGYCIHTLRHTYATRLIQARVNIVLVQALLGHSSITTTQRYVHTDLSDLTSAVQNL